MAGVITRSTVEEIAGSSNLDTTKQHNKVITDLATLQGGMRHNRVVGNIAAGLTVHGSQANDLQTTTAISIWYAGLEYPVAAQTLIDSSTTTINLKTIATSKAGAGWVFAKYDGTIDMSQSEDASSLQTSAIGGLARYSVGTNVLPPSAGFVPIGVASVVEGGSGVFTWGSDSITAETEVYYSFRGQAGVVTAAASFAATGGATATFAYGAGVARLGTGVVVAYTGKTGVAFDALNKTTVPQGKTGAWLFYVLADDVEIAMQLGGAGYDTLDLARAAVAAHVQNPLLPWIGAIYVHNNSGADFVPATTNLNVSGIAATFDIRAAYSPTSILTASKIGNESGVEIT